MAAIFGGAVLVVWLAARGPSATIVDVAVRYEQVFWAGLGVIVMTGVGNLGAFGLALPAPATTWGGTFALKILALVVLLAASVPRSLVITRLAGGANAPSRTLLWSYGGTVVILAVIAALAVWLAHG
jgi:hypothetical protein